MALKKLIHMGRCGADSSTIVAHFTGRISSLSNQNFKAEALEFRNTAKDLKLSNDWFTRHIAKWLPTFSRYLADNEKPYRFLEVGSFEGLSAVFLSQQFPNATITCVDTWEGGDEHSGTDYISDIENRFDHNTRSVAQQIQKRKMTSFEFFVEHSPGEQFDLVYIDGSHHADDVIIDATKGFEALKVGGIMIFDDFLWQHYDNPKDNPAGAICAFLRLKKGHFKPLLIGSQVQILKTKSADRS